jgi:cytochrome c553
MAAAPDAPHGEVLYLKHCTRCHSPAGWGKGPAAVPSLAGQREYYLIEQLIQVSTLERNVPEMHRVLTAPDLDRPQAVRDLAAYLAHAPRDPHSEQGSGRDLSKGEQVYKRQCAMCHGKNGEGSEDEPIPAVGGQHYDYLLTQLRGFAAGHRGTVEPPVLDFTAGLSSPELAAVADYMSRLSPLPSEEKAPRK